MISKKLVWRTAAKFKGDFSITELIDELSKEVSEKELLSERNFYDYNDIIKVVSLITGISKEKMLSRTRLREAVKARQIAMYLIYKYTQFSTTIVGAIFNRDHATMIYAKNTIEDSLNGYDPILRGFVEKCEKCVLMQQVSYTKNMHKVSFKDYKPRNMFKGWEFDDRKISEIIKE